MMQCKEGGERDSTGVYTTNTMYTIHTRGDTQYVELQ